MSSQTVDANAVIHNLRAINDAFNLSPQINLLVSQTREVAEIAGFPTDGPTQVVSIVHPNYGELFTISYHEEDGGGFLLCPTPSVVSDESTGLLFLPGDPDDFSIERFMYVFAECIHCLVVQSFASLFSNLGDDE